MNSDLQLLAAQMIDGLHLEDLRPADIDPDAPLFAGGLGLDSIDALELAVIIERQYGVRIGDAEIGKQAFASLRSLHQHIHAKIAGSSKVVG